MITTLTLNPSVDRTMGVGALRVGAVISVAASSAEPGGKGVNVARALATNGCPARAVFPADEDYARWTRQVLEPLGVDCVVVRRSAATRTNLSITECDGTTTKLNESGEPLSAAVLAALLDAVVAAEAGSESGVGTGVVASGSVPPGVDADVYARLADRLVRPAQTLAVDTSGAALAALVGHPCAVVKPNLDELEALVGAPLPTQGQVVAAADELRAQGWASVLVSLGAAGAVLVDADGAWHGSSTGAVVRNTVGAGDALLAGYVSTGVGGPEGLAEGLAWSHAAVGSPATAAPPVTDRHRESVTAIRPVEPGTSSKEQP